MKRFFVTATDTGVGKTEVSCALLSLLARAGERPFAFKPYESGHARPSDAQRMRAAAGRWQPLESICIHRFRAAVAPGVAAELETGPSAVKQNPFAQTLRAYAAFEGSGIVEGAGGPFVPLDAKHDVIHLIEKLALPTVLVARAGLGTLNHTALSLEALESRRVKVAAVVLVKSVSGKDASEAHNLRWLQKRHSRVRFLGPVPFVTNARQRSAAFEKVLRPLL